MGQEVLCLDETNCTKGFKLGKKQEYNKAKEEIKNEK